MKAYTDLEQSKKLAEILPIESADMWWNFYSVTTDDTTPLIIHLDTPWVGSFNWANKSNNVPCWSLAALLDVIPKRIKNYNILRIDISDKDFAIWYDEVSYGVNNNLPDITTESAVDACYEMIIKLHEQNFL